MTTILRIRGPSDSTGYYILASTGRNRKRRYSDMQLNVVESGCHQLRTRTDMGRRGFILGLGVIVALAGGVGRRQARGIGDRQQHLRQRAGTAQSGE